MDREPTEHDGYIRCKAHEITEAALGPGNGFRLRELLIGDVETRIRNLLANGGTMEQAKALLPTYHGLCYLCHLWMVFCHSIDQRDKLAERMRRDMPNQNADNMDVDEDVIILNDFMVYVDIEGEYDHNKMLTGSCFF